jgi:hypothetical protein
MLRAVALLLSLLIAGAAVAAPQKMTIKDIRKGYEIDVSYPRFGQQASRTVGPRK